MAAVLETSADAFVANATRIEQDGLSSQVQHFLSSFFAGWSNLQIAVTVLLLLVSYDQCLYTKNAPSLPLSATHTHEQIDTLSRKVQSPALRSRSPSWDHSFKRFIPSSKLI